tara:strand:+ start:3073 stop:4302 length:1230 start_codon:yes stop_codon:yes gene_type:complete
MADPDTRSVIDSYEPTNLTIDRSVGSTANLAPDVDRVYSGADVIAFIVPKASHYTNTPYIPLKNLGAISYSIHRDKVPVRSLGMSKARSYTLGTRTVAGTLVLLNFDRAALSELILGNDIYGDNIQVSLYDEIPPFDLVLTFSSEHNGRTRGGLTKPQSFAVLEIKNVRLIDEGLVTGTEEAYLETTFQYVAETVKYLQPVELNKVVPDFGEFAAVNREILQTTNTTKLNELTNAIQDAPSKVVIDGPEKAFKLEHSVGPPISYGSSFSDPIKLSSVIGPNSSYILVLHKSAIHTTGNIHITEWHEDDIQGSGWPNWTQGSADNTYANLITDPTKEFTFVVLGETMISSPSFTGQGQAAYYQDSLLIHGTINKPLSTAVWYSTANQAYAAGKLLWAQIQFELQSSPGII